MTVVDQPGRSQITRTRDAGRQRDATDVNDGRHAEAGKDEHRGDDAPAVECAAHVLRRHADI